MLVLYLYKNIKNTQAQFYLYAFEVWSLKKFIKNHEHLPIIIYFLAKNVYNVKFCYLWLESYQLS